MMYSNDVIRQKIAHIAKIRNLTAWDNYFNRVVGIVQSHIARLNAFANLPNSSARAKQSIGQITSELQTALDTAIAQHYQNK